MQKRLDDEQVRRYRDDGIVFPLTAFEPGVAAAYLQKLQDQERQEGGKLTSSSNRKPHLLMPWLDELIRTPRILDAVEDLIGPNILCWTSSFFAKNARDPGFISWHQDATYWGLSTSDVLTAWVALTDSSIDNGCMQVVPGSHKAQIEHRDTFRPDNMLSRGQEIAVDVAPEQALPVLLEPGQFSIHNVLIIHGSEPNRSDRRRVGIAIRYIPTHVQQVLGVRDSAMLVRGIDEYGHFEPEARPRMPFDEAAIAQHATAIAMQVHQAKAAEARRSVAGRRQGDR
ncbi:MAG: phytanoyl-CoA dioxygenase family protein [Lautropia sp.]